MTAVALAALLSHFALAQALDAGEPVVVPPSLLQDSPARPGTTPGDVELSVSIDAQGEVLEAQVTRSPTAALASSALDAVGGLRFSPALRDGQPVPVAFTFTYHFAAAPAPVLLAQIEGAVLSRGNRLPLPGAEIIVDPALDGGVSATAGPGGKFAIDVTVGGHDLLVRAGGYQSQTFHETLTEAQKIQVLYRLSPTGVSAFQTIVRAPSDRTEVSRLTLTGAELHDVAGTMGDPLRVIMLLPGVGSVVSGVAYPVVRGADPAETGYYLDGIPIPILFHLFLGPEVISPDFIESVDFYPSNPPADEGRHLAGAVSVTSKAPKDDGAHVTAYADLINAGAFAEVAFPKTGTSVSVAGRISYTGLVTEVIADALESPGSPPLVLNFADYQARIDQKVGDGHLRLFVFGSSDSAGTGAAADVPEMVATIDFIRADLRYQHALEGGQAEVGLTYGDDDVAESNSFKLSERSVRLRASWKRDFSPQLHALVGMDADYRHVDLQSELADFSDQGFTGVGNADGSFSGVYAELTWRPTARWSLTPAFRLDNYYRAPNIDDLAAEPRVTARYELREGLYLKAGWGIVHEPPVLLIDLPAIDLGALGHGLQEACRPSWGRSGPSIAATSST